MSCWRTLDGDCKLGVVAVNANYSIEIKLLELRLQFIKMLYFAFPLCTMKLLAVTLIEYVIRSKNVTGFIGCCI